MRLAWLFLRSRLVGHALVCLVGLAALAGAWLHWLGVRGATTLSLILSLAVAAVIGTGARSPFGDVERSAGRRLPALRLGHLAGLLVFAVFVLALATDGRAGDSFAWTLARNLAGFAGIALLAARAIGAGLAWVAPLAYGVCVYAFVPNPHEPGCWAWPLHAGTEREAAAIAAALLLAGLAAVAHGGAREAPGEAV